MTTTPALARDAALTVATHAADPRLVLTVDRVIAEWTASGLVFSANDCRAAMPTVSPGLIGSRVKAASMRREIVAVGWVDSDLVSTKVKKIRRWQSAAAARQADRCLMCGGPA